eukprot:2104034-Amphidinium_carterae.1
MVAAGSAAAHQGVQRCLVEFQHARLASGRRVLRSAMPCDFAVDVSRARFRGSIPTPLSIP